ncbi:CPBP family intramembrane metalloprotease [Mucilaginibacter sp. HMF5004]|uniref:CPBP family intramembrane glutamic endopeptidase n=1 Tax=Mucilaginibacter rivuli TaxID=2857527 RepID=UPI001C5D4403|nr:type II CAAX endopeptidase family protein [Mucilaginibacter rivuli]MBW4889505.1 CPBP family intramembrane metalloprotease [Mucilaginibacter rivuli]
MNNTLTQTEVAVFKNCTHCDGEIAFESRFCRHCGVVQKAQDDITSEQKWNSIQYAGLFYLLNIGLCCLFKFIDSLQTLAISFIFDGLLAIVAVVFFCSNWAENKMLLRWPNFSIVKLAGYCLGAILASLLVGFSVRWINHTLFSEELYYSGLYRGHKYANELMVLSIAFMPAIFEELGFRGYMLQNLLGVSDKKQAIFITSFLFAILHLSFLSLFWLIPFALLQGYIRVKENTLWYGVCIHFFFNLTVCISEIWRLR